MAYETYRIKCDFCGKTVIDCECDLPEIDEEEQKC